MELQVSFSAPMIYEDLPVPPIGSFFFEVVGNPLHTGPYALIFENRPVLVAEEMENFFLNLGQVPSAIMDYNFESTVGYLTSKFEYFNQYGTIGTP